MAAQMVNSRCDNKAIPTVTLIEFKNVTKLLRPSPTFEITPSNCIFNLLERPISGLIYRGR